MSAADQGGNVAAPSPEPDRPDDAGRVPRIVVGVDGSESSKAALRWAGRLAETLDARIDAVTVWEPALAFGWGILPPTYSPQLDLERRLDEVVDEVFPDGRPDGLRAKVLEGPTAATLLRVARGAVMLAVGSRGLGGFPGLLLGSVSAKLTAHSVCPVLVVHSG